MDKFNFDKQLNSLQRNHGLYKKLLILMFVINIALIFVLSKTVGQEKIILVPQVAPEYKLWVSSNQVSNEYLAVLSRNVMDLLLNVTPINVQAQHKELLNIVASQYQALLQNKLAKISQPLQQNNISQNFYINNIRIIKGKPIVYIYGTVNDYLDKTLTSSNEQIYRLTFDTQNYGTKLSNVELIDNTDAQLKDLNNAN